MSYRSAERSVHTTSKPCIPPKHDTRRNMQADIELKGIWRWNVCHSSSNISRRASKTSIVYALSWETTSPIRVHIPVSKCWYHRPSLGHKVATKHPLTELAKSVRSSPPEGESSHKTVRVARALWAVPYFTVDPVFPFYMERMSTMTAASIPKCA
jgi:hypothetical protein